MKLEQTNPSDLFNTENFLTATDPSASKMSDAERILLEEAERAAKANSNTFASNVSAMHTEEQEPTPGIKNDIREKYSRPILAQERAEAAVQNLKPSKYGPNIPLAKDVFSDIISSGDYREVITAFNHTWEIRALEQSDILCAADDVRDTADGRLGYLSSLSFAKLVYAIEGVDGYSIYELFPDIIASTFLNKIDYIIAVKMAMRAYLLAFPFSVIEELTAEHTRIENARDEKIRKLKKF